MNKLGFGFLRLPRLDPDDQNSVDIEKCKELVDLFISKGGRYFDTAYTYLDGNSEIALGQALCRRYPRSSYEIAAKLPCWKITTQEEAEEIFARELDRCKVDYFDNYLLHWVNAENYKICKKYDAFAFLCKVKAEGKAKHIGFSYHDTAELLDKILTEEPCVEIVQLQLNWLDWRSPSIEAEKCYEVCVKHGKKVIVMEPVRGGTLTQLPSKAEEILKNLDSEKSIASWAIRFASQPESVVTVLSGMNDINQIEDNMQDYPPLTDAELNALEECRNIIRNQSTVPCTGCRYCVAGCPEKIAIPDYFKMYNELERSKGRDDWKIKPAYRQMSVKNGKASDCINCRNCERNCPQKIDITGWLKKVAEALEDKQ